MKLNELKNKKILILGLGKEGMDNFKFLRRIFSKKVLGVADRLEFKKLDEKVKKIIFAVSCDRRKISIKLHLGENYLKALKDYEVIIKSPGILPKVIAPFVTKKQRITSQTEIFFENCPGKIVGITGTKGKSTTASLIYQILKKGGIKAHLVGNIGKPVLNLLFSATPKDVYVYELSSHQLYNLKKSPQIAVFLNIYPEHLDYYKNFKEYIKAKTNIFRWQTKKDYLIYNSQDQIIKEVVKKSKAKKIPIKLDGIKIEDIPLKGEFNLQNVAAAIEVAKIFGISDEKITKAIRNFKPLPHRLELVGTFKGITFYNDALSTIPETTIFALEALGKRAQTIILGGYDRKINFKKLVKYILKNKNIKNLILFPTTGEKIWRVLKLTFHHWSKNYAMALKLPRHFFVDNMRDAVKLAYEHTQKGKICLLSCASSSFSIFRDYKEKGNLFKKYVKKYGKRV
ncbi:MAG: UDP-N-acetylmuramoyl-L-alanine--D-glutamate ligase [Patescibacteria group bacterium]|nr:UDP-N-acetylmuramoyl-L-alanine--D-glutamate ligase [Patescibacteria group bacterium]